MHAMSRPAVQPLLRKALSTSKILSAERERELLTRYHADGDKAAMDELVRSHMPIIFRVAGRSAQNPGVDINDLVQTATEGLLIAINRWSFEKSDASGARYANAAQDAAAPSAAEAPAPASAAASDDDEGAQPDAPPSPLRSSRLATYAMWWMRIMLTDSVIQNRGMVVRVKSPKARKALFGLPMAIRKLDICPPLSGHDVTRISAYLGVAERDVEEALIHAAGDMMIDEPVGEGGVSRGDAIPDGRAEGENGILNRLTSADCWDAVCDALMSLSARDRFILITRHLLTPKWKLDRLSDTLKMSRERIRQIAGDGLARIRSRVGSANVCHNPARHRAAAEVEALVSRIEHASASADPGVLAALFREQQIKVGPMRIVNREMQAEQPASVLRSLPSPALAPMLEASGA